MTSKICSNEDRVTGNPPSSLINFIKTIVTPPEMPELTEAIIKAITPKFNLPPSETGKKVYMRNKPIPNTITLDEKFTLIYNEAKRLRRVYKL